MIMMNSISPIVVAILIVLSTCCIRITKTRKLAMTHVFQRSICSPPLFLHQSRYYYVVDAAVFLPLRGVVFKILTFPCGREQTQAIPSHERVDFYVTSPTSDFLSDRERTCLHVFFFTLYVSGLTARNPLVTNVLMEGKQYDNNKCKRETEKEICSKSQLVRDRSIKPVHPESSNIWTRGCPPTICRWNVERASLLVTISEQLFFNNAGSSTTLAATE